MTFKPLELQDCQNIIKTFEKGAAYCVTEESVFAMMSALLVGIRTQSSSLFRQLEAGDALALPKSTKEEAQETVSSDGTTSQSALGQNSDSVNLGNLDKADEDDDGLLAKVRGNFFPGGTDPDATDIPSSSLSSGFIADCIPCLARIITSGELSPAKFLDANKEYLLNWINWLTEQILMLTDLVGIFVNTNNYIDICSLIKFFSDYVCVPDIQRMLSTLMALMSRVSIELGGPIDIILGLIGPIVGPLLSGFVDLLQSFILLITKPIECIVDSVQQIIEKLDYNVLFGNIDSLERHPSIGSPLGVDVKIPFLDVDVSYEIPARGEQADKTTVAAEREDAINQQAIETAAIELNAIRKAGKKIDSADRASVERYKAQKEGAEGRYRAALDRASEGLSGRTGGNADRTVSNMKSSLYTLLGYLTEAVSVVEGFFQECFDELKKLIGAYNAGGGNFIEQLIKKMGLVQMIGLIAAIAKAFLNGITCGDDDDIRVESFIPEAQGFKIWTDDEGLIHIEEDDEDFKEAVEAMVDAAGASNNDLIEASDPVKVRLEKDKDKGSAPSSDESRQKLKSLVEFTGDPVLDTQIARATEALVTKVDVTFKCPLQTNVEQAEQVNKWIMELNSE